MSTAATFTHGVASFDPVPDGVLLWTRVEGAERVRWHLAERAAHGGPRGQVRSGTVPVDPDSRVATVAVDGLRPGTDHLYWFRADGVASPRGRTRTAPDGAAGSWRLALVCCADHSINHLTAYRAVAEADVDVVVHLGDYIYETRGKGERTQDPDRDCVTLEDYDRRYAQLRADPALQALHARHPMITIWDDHDIADNAWAGGAKGHDEEEHGPWAQRLLAAAGARQRWLPARLEDPSDPTRLWRSFRAGDLAELVVTDTRIAGRDQQAGDPGAGPLEDPDRSLLGEPQRAWLRDRIADRSARWCLLATQVTMHPMALPVPTGATLLEGAPSGYGLVDGAGVCLDEWDGYPAERERVARWLAARGSDAVIVSGDVHSSWVFDGHLAPGVPAVAPEFVVPSVSSTPMGRQLPRGWRKVASALAGTADGARWYEVESWGFTTLEVTPRHVSAAWHLVDASGTDPATELAATWVVDTGDPGSLRPVGPLRAPLELSRPSAPLVAGAALAAAAAAWAARRAVGGRGAERRGFGSRVRG